VQRELHRRRKATREDAIRAEALRRGVSVETVRQEKNGAAANGAVRSAGNGAAANGSNGATSHDATSHSVASNGTDAAAAALQQLHDLGDEYADVYDGLVSGTLSPAEAAATNKRLSAAVRAVKATLTQDHQRR
jgi:hypothetical protein